MSTSTQVQPAKSRKPLWKRWWVWVAVVAVIAIAASAGGGSSEPVSEHVPAAPVDNVPEAPAEQVTETPGEQVTEASGDTVTDAPGGHIPKAGNTAPAQPAAPDVTPGQANALDSAMQYLEYSSFSHSGLIKQLEFEGYSTEDATWAVDSLDVDWNKQAAKKAQEYLDMTSFSRDGLIKQLEFEGFTAEQAEYAMGQVGY